MINLGELYMKEIIKKEKGMENGKNIHIFYQRKN